MSRVVFASTRASAGKTSLILGIMKAGAGRDGYMKPFGDRLLYRKKRLWDHDAALMTNVFGLTAEPENITLGFDHSKLRFMYEPEALAARLEDMAGATGSGKDNLFVEGGRDMSAGMSLGLDPASLAASLKARLVVMVPGTVDEALDDCAFLASRTELGGADLAGVVLNRVADPDMDGDLLGEQISGMGLKVLGILPARAELERFGVGYLAEFLFARVISGEGSLDRNVQHVFVGSMSAEAALRDPALRREGTLVITSGDRSDMILGALQSGAAAVVLTNNILPPSNIISRAGDAGIPLLLASADTYSVAKQLDGMEPLLTKDDGARMGILEEMVREGLDTAALLG